MRLRRPGYAHPHLDPHRSATSLGPQGLLVSQLALLSLNGAHVSGAWKNLPKSLKPRRSAVWLLDKSAVQAWSQEDVEAYQFNNIHQNVPPILMLEILGNLAK